MRGVVFELLNVNTKRLPGLEGSGSKAVTDPSVGFHQSCLNELARSLSQVNKAVDEKVSIRYYLQDYYYYYYIF